jgi:hypothetical protein
MLSFKVFGNMIFLIYNPIFKGISHASKWLDFGGIRFWRKSKREKEGEKKIYNSYIGSMTPFVGQIDKA